MTAPVRMLVKLLWVAAALVVVIFSVLWASQSPEPPSASGVRARPGLPTAEVTVEATATPAAAPTPTPEPTPVPTPTPTPVEFLDAVDEPQWEGLIESPMPGCTFAPDAATTVGAKRLMCMTAGSTAEVAAVADGRVVHIVDTLETSADVRTPAGEWSWNDQQMLGRHVVVDHGPIGELRSVQTVYAALDEIDGELAVGDAVIAGDRLGSSTGSPPSMLFSVWIDDIRQDGASLGVAAPDFESQQAVAAALGEAIVSPTDPLCPLSLSVSQLPGASRSYRNGTHQGIDFGCGAADRFAHAIADGEVVYLVDEYVDPSVGEREALLANAGRAGFTPHWTLLMLYGNVVIIDHGVIDGAGRVVTIAAHLEQVDPEIRLGGQVDAGQVLGEIGNRGTNASALGLRGGADPSLHLHWELFVDGWYLGAGLNTPQVVDLVRTAMCGAAQVAGCPG